MATSSRKRNHCTLLKLSLSLLLLFCLFFFTRRVLDPKISLHGDFVSLTPVPLLPPPRSAEFVEKFDESTKHVSSVSGSVENVDANVTSPEFQEENNEEPSESVQDAEKTTTVRLDDATKPVSSVSDSVENVDANVTSPEFQEENNGESSKSVENAEKAVSSSDSESEGNLGEITDKPMSSNEETDVPISSKSDLDDKTRENMQVENVPSEETEVGVDDDVKMDEKWQNCDLYQGKWVKDEGYPLYEPGSCPYVDEAFDCQNNGRPDSEYLKWRWKPDECDLPRFNATDFLVRLRGKKLLLVGDSMNRNQFESLLCLLREGLTDKSKMYEVHGYKITKGRGYFIFKFEDYDCTVEFVRSHFLVREGVRVNAQGNSNPTLSIDRIDKTARRWQRADILVFNTGHWWTHGKTARGKNYYKEGNFLYPRFDAVEAYRRAIRTWANWVKRHLSKDKLVFYRGYSSAHFRGGDWDSGGSCNGETEPVKSGPILDSYPQKMTIVEDILKETKVPVVLLNVTHLTNYRKDGHPSVYGKNVTAGKKVSTRRQDCSHWCVPGVPDAWNELIYATLVARQN